MTARTISFALLGTLVLLSAPIAAQEGAAPTPPDHVTLANGDRLTGKVVALADGKLKFATDMFGEVEIPMDNVKDLVTQHTVVLRTGTGEELKRRITGIEAGNLKLADAEQGPQGVALKLEDLAAINPPEKEKPKWKGSINVGAILTDGNSERRSVTASADAQRRSEIDRITVKASWNYAEERSGGTWQLTDRRTAGSLQYDYFLNDHSYLLATTAAQGDTLADIRLRYTAGVGYGYQWIEEDDLSFSTEAGINYFSEEFRSNNPSTDNMAARLAYTLEWGITESLKFLQDVNYFPSLESSDDLFLWKSSRLQLSLTETMFTQFQWILNYDNTPSPGQERVDQRFLVTVGWNF